MGNGTRWDFWVRRMSEDQPDGVVIQRILLLEYLWVSTTPSAEAKLLCCFCWNKSILGVIALWDSRSSSISAGHWDDPLASVGSPRVITIVWWWWFRGYFIQAVLELWTSAYWELKKILFSQYYLSGTENWTVTLLSWVSILIHFLSKVLFIFFIISPELIWGFHWLKLRVNLPVLHLASNVHLQPRLP